MPSHLLTAKRCMCGGAVETRGECAACRARRVAGFSQPSLVAGLGSLPIGSPHDGRERAAAAAAVRVLDARPTRRVMRPPAPGTRDPLGASGASLPGALASDLGSRLGHDFSRIRVFSDNPSARAAHALRADAFTVGQNVYFAHDRYRPETPAGRSLIAHELAHTIQQASGPALIQRRLAGNCASPLENVDEQRDELSRVGREAHLQIESHFSGVIAHERRVPRADKRAMGRACPGVTTSYGAADLVKFSGMTASVGEIKSVEGAQFAAPEVQHYIQRGNEAVGRLLGTGPCRGRADTRDETFDANWFSGAVERTHRAPTLRPLDSGVPVAPTDLGRFEGNPAKDLRCERRAGGAVVYWCVPRGSRRRSDSRESQRAVIPVARPQAQPQQLRRARIVDVGNGFEDAARRMRPMRLPVGRDLIIAFDPGMYDRAVRAAEQRYLEQQQRMMRVNLPAYPAFTAGLAAAMVGGAIAAPVVIAFIIIGGAEVIAAGAMLAAEVGAGAVVATEVGTGAVVTGEVGTAGALGTGALTAGEVGTSVAATGGAGTAAVGGAGTAVGATAGTYTTSTGITLTVIQGGAGTAGATVATGGVLSISAPQAAAAAAAIALTAGISQADASTGIGPYLGRPLAAVVDVTADGLRAHGVGSTISVQGGSFRTAITLTTRDQP